MLWNWHGGDIYCEFQNKCLVFRLRVIWIPTLSSHKTNSYHSSGMFKVKCKTNIRLFLFTFFYFLGSRLCFPGIPKARTDPRSLCPITWSSWSPRKRLFPPTPSQRPSSKSQTPSRPSNLSINLLSILKLFQNIYWNVRLIKIWDNNII